jgi:hypothetical protein
MAGFTLKDQSSIKVVGLRELRRDLKKIDPQLQKQLSNVTKKAAARVVEDTKSRVPVVDGTARKSIRATSSGARAFIVGGKKSVPYFGWLDFGSRTPRSGLRRTTGPWHLSGKGPKGGRYIYPAIAKNLTSFQKDLAKAIKEVKRKAGLS